MSALSFSQPYVAPLPPVAAADRFTRRMIHLYVFLLIFEGAIRKWILPGLATPLLLVRDPLVLLIIASYWQAGRRLINIYTLPLLVAGILSLLLTLAFAHGNVVIAVFGLRTLVLHFFLIFIIGEVFDRKEVERVGRYVVYLLPLITVLIGLQFYSPQSAWVNRGVGGDVEGAGFSGAMGYFRPSGTFSFTNGLTTFYGLAVAYVFYFWGEPSRINRLTLLAGTVSVIAAIPLSISRGYLFQVGLTVFFFVVASLRSGRSIRTLLIALVASPLLIAILSNFGFIQTGVEVLTTRFALAAKSEGGLEGTLGERFLGGLIQAFSSGDTPWYGQGLGLGTNVGSTILTGGRTFLVAEGEWNRVAGEMGPILGIIVILLRIVLAGQMMLAGIGALFRNNSLPFLLLSFGFLQVLQGGWSQPTALGFSVLSGGLIIASFNRP
ncbi:hypothetical protein [Lewinella sp. JB7]|uniref:hypothetical protein n=1 Tax=Lewinella sp. JB7 TaxID=2962887 RepID=UPI0020C9989B|nr:hypothetical protein [Lewinella sp. JB7]MCP9234506.1 hypothetical protein [Lewinella sp. JB7]